MPLMRPSTLAMVLPMPPKVLLAMLRRVVVVAVLLATMLEVLLKISLAMLRKVVVVVVVAVLLEMMLEVPLKVSLALLRKVVVVAVLLAMVLELPLKVPELAARFPSTHSLPCPKRRREDPSRCRSWLVRSGLSR